MARGSYRPDETSGGLDGEIDRLDQQVALSWKEEQRLLKDLVPPDSRRILEIGSGAGHFTAKLLEQFPSSRLTAIDVRTDFLSLARTKLQAHRVPRVDLMQASIYETGFVSESFDCAIARFVFQHLDNAERAGREIFRVLRPGGRAVIIDIDAALWGLVQPHNQALQSIYAKAETLTRARSGNRFIGRQLWRLLDAWGFTETRLEAFVYHSDDLGADSFDIHLNPDRLAPALSSGAISTAEFVQLQEEYRRFRQSPDRFVLMVGLLAHGVKPAG